MSDKEKALARIERTLETICAEIGELRTRVDALAAAGPAADAPDVAEVVSFLDAFRAGEAFGELSIGAWIEASDVACVRGGLRTVQQREGFHARLLEDRIKELGGTCTAEVPQAVYDAGMARATDTECGDAAKVLAFVEQFPDIDAALRPIHALADRLDADPETQSLLRTIAQDERSTLEWFHEACGQLNAA